MRIEREASLRRAKNSEEPKTLVDQPIAKDPNGSGEFVVLKVINVGDLYQKDAHYDWSVNLNLSEVAGIVKVASWQIKTNPERVREVFKGCILDLIRLLACATEGLGRLEGEKKVNQVNHRYVS
jgi:hypothetical protein